MELETSSLEFTVEFYPLARLFALAHLLIRWSRIHLIPAENHHESILPITCSHNFLFDSTTLECRSKKTWDVKNNLIMAQYISNLVQDKLFSVNHLMRYVDKNCTLRRQILNYRKSQCKSLKALYKSLGHHKRSFTCGKGRHVLPGTWPLLIPFRGSGAFPSNLENQIPIKSSYVAVALPQIVFSVSRKSLFSAKEPEPFCLGTKNS